MIAGLFCKRTSLSETRFDAILQKSLIDVFLITF